MTMVLKSSDNDNDVRELNDISEDGYTDEGDAVSHEVADSPER